MECNEKNESIKDVEVGFEDIRIIKKFANKNNQDLLIFVFISALTFVDFHSVKSKQQAPKGSWCQNYDK